MSFRNVFHIIKRNAGHSKWQNIRHIKAEKDGQRSALFVKFAQRIKVAIRENANNSNPSSNIQLAQIIEYARSNDMPLTTIQNIIKSTQVDKDAAQPCRYGIKGPRGSILLVTALTSSLKRTKQDISFKLKKVGGIMADQSVENMFDKKGVIVALPPPNMENIEETSVEHAIEAGAEEVLPLDEDKTLTFFCGMSDLHRARSKLQELNYDVKECKITFIPKMKVNLNNDEMTLMSGIIAALELIPEVTEIHDNIE